MEELRKMKVYSRASKKVGFVERFDRKHGLVVSCEKNGIVEIENILPADAVFLADAKIVDHAGQPLFEYDYIRHYLHGEISSNFYILRFGPYQFENYRHIGFYLEKVGYVDAKGDRKEKSLKMKERETFPIGVLFEDFNNSFYVDGSLLDDPKRFKPEKEIIPELEVARFTI